jgi:hypothetical protein
MNIWLKLRQINDASDSSMNEHLTKITSDNDVSDSSMNERLTEIMSD